MSELTMARRTEFKRRFLQGSLLMAFAAGTLGLATAPCMAQKSGDLNMSLHAHDKATAADVGLPLYPGATTYKKDDDDSSSADLGFSFGDFKFSLLVAEYQTADPGWKVFGFYRTALGKYGQVLECDHGHAVGSPSVTNTGLTCDDDDKKEGSGFHASDSTSDGRELRVGTPKKFRVVGLNDPSKDGKTRFAMIYIELPKDSDEKTD
jgi:hypothetical protein